MPERQEHLNQSAHNIDFATTIDGTRHSDWLATVLFYAALQQIDAFLAKSNIHPPSHDVRDRIIGKTRELKPLAKQYWQLKNASRNARYYPPTRYTPKQLEGLRDLLGVIQTALK